MEVYLDPTSLFLAATLSFDPHRGSERLLHTALSLPGVRVGALFGRLCRGLLRRLHAALDVANAETLGDDVRGNLDLVLRRRECEKRSGVPRRQFLLSDERPHVTGQTKKA